MVKQKTERKGNRVVVEGLKNIAYDKAKKKYYATFYYGKDENGKATKKVVPYNTKDEAVTALKVFEGNRAKGEVVLPVTDTLASWLIYWLEEILKPNREATTAYGYEGIIKRYIIPNLGDIKLQKLNPEMITRYYNKMIRDKNLSSNTVHKHHDLLKCALRVAVNQDKILRNPVDRVEPPAIVENEKRYYNQEQLAALMDAAAGHRLEIVILLAGYCGLRREEIVGLKWENVDLDKRILSITEVRTSAGNKIITKRPKTKTSLRTEYICDDLFEVFKRLKKEYLENKLFFGNAFEDSGLIVTFPDGKPYRPNYISELVTKFIIKNGFPPLHLHELRHSFASIANNLGIPLYNIGRALGHASTSVTSKVYTHLIDTDHESTMTTVSDSISKYRKTAK